MKHQVILSETKNVILKCSSPSLVVQEVCLVEVKPQVPLSSTNLCNDQDETFSNISSLIASLPNKVYENCQRTARVIMLSQLEKHMGKNKKLKQQLSKNLQNFLPQNNEDMQEKGQYTSKTNYFKSLHYSRVRIGQRYFINKILLNPVFKQKFQLIFAQQTYQSCQKARKNQNSRISFEKRKAVITSIIKQFKKTFHDFFNDYQLKEKEVKENSNKNNQYIDNIQIQQQKQPKNYITEQEVDTRMCYFFMPIIPIPLSPFQYRCYQEARNIYE